LVGPARCSRGTRNVRYRDRGYHCRRVRFRSGQGRSAASNKPDSIRHRGENNNNTYRASPRLASSSARLVVVLGARISGARGRRFRSRRECVRPRFVIDATAWEIAGISALQERRARRTVDPAASAPLKGIALRSARTNRVLRRLALIKARGSTPGATKSYSGSNVARVREGGRQLRFLPTRTASYSE